MYLQGLAEAAQCHTEKLKAEEHQQAEDDTLKDALGLAWEPPKKRLCIGICVTDGEMTKAWEWELDKGAEVQVHIKATKKEYPGQWFRHGKPLREEEIPPSLKSTSSRAPAIKLPKQYDLNQPATRELYQRWRRGQVSNQTVVTMANTDMLAFFYAVRDMPKQESTGANEAPPGTEQPEHVGADSVVTVADTAPTSTPEPDDSDAVSNPSTYYNGRRWAQRHGFPESDDDSRGQSD